MNASARSMEQPHRWPLVNQFSNRDETFLKDARLVNCIAEKDPNTGEYVVQKRIGYDLAFSPTGGSYTVPGGFNLANGMFHSVQLASGPFLGNTTGAYSVFSRIGPLASNASLYLDGQLVGTSGGLEPLPAGKKYSFALGGGFLVFAGSAFIYYRAGSSSWATVTLPSDARPPVVGLAYLDQTFYFMDGLGQIFGSALDNPTSWTNLNKVVANSVFGIPIQLTQQLNYVIALKSNSMEVFFDNANPPPGSPLSPVAGALSNYGGVAGTVQSIDDTLFFGSSNRTATMQIMRVDNLQLKKVSTPQVERVLDQIPSIGPVFTSFSFKHGGSRFYGLTYQGSSGLIGFVDVASFTIILDIDKDLWYQWGDPNGNFWPVADMSVNRLGQGVLQGMSDGTGRIFEGDYQFPTDGGVVAPVHIYTPNTDFGTRRNKTLHQIYFNTDQQVGSILYVSRSDDDYKTWSIPRRVDLGDRRPRMRNEGTFSRRAYHIKHISPKPFRIRSMDLQMDIGES